MTAEEKLEEIKRLCVSTPLPGHLVGAICAVIDKPTTEAPSSGVPLDLFAGYSPEDRARLAFSWQHPSGGGLMVDATTIEKLAERFGGRVVWGGK